MKQEEDEELAMEFSKGQNDAQIDISGYLPFASPVSFPHLPHSQQSAGIRLTT